MLKLKRMLRRVSIQRARLSRHHHTLASQTVRVNLYHLRLEDSHLLRKIRGNRPQTQITESLGDRLFHPAHRQNLLSNRRSHDEVRPVPRGENLQGA